MILTVTTTKWTRTNSPVLGSRKVDLPNEPEDEGHEGDGGKCQECTRQCATCPNSTVSLLLHRDVTIFSSPCQLCEPCCPLYQCVRPGLVWSGSSVGKPKVSWPPNITA